LHEQHRQEDEKFLGFLSALRSNTLTEEHHDYLTSRIYHYDDIPEEVPKLFPHNANVDRLNDEALSHLTTDSHIYEMESEGHPALTAAIMRSCLSPEKLTLKVGAAVMFTKNNPNLGFANGTLGVVTGFDMYSSYPIVETRDGQTIVAEPMEWAVEENGKVRARIVQVPLRLAWAMTIHKSQGMSLDAAVMDLSGSFEFGQGYVALSRVRTLKGLYMLGWNEQALKVHPEILEQDAGFKAQSDEAGALFKKLPATELEKMQNNFIIASGGTLIKKKRVPQTKFKKQKIDTRRVSLELFRAGKTVEEIAEERGMTTSTVFNHLEKLLELKVFQKEEVLKLLPKKIVSHVAQIQQAFIDLNTYKLTPVREHFKDRFSFDELHLVRMTMERLPEQEDK
jgi:ATP-dependent DNA helicase PIF1